MEGIGQEACVSCGTKYGASYCPNCGERRLDHHSLSLSHFAEHAFEAFVHFDGSIFRTLKTLVTSPGRLTADYAIGRRKPYLAPVQFFLIVNLLFFLMQGLHGWNTLTTDLATHTSGTWHQDFARSMVAKKLAAKGISEEAYRSKFDAKAGIQAKSLVILMVPFFALGVALVHAWLGRYFVEHLVFSVHFYAFFLLYLTVTSFVANGVLLALSWAGVSPGVGTVDAWVSGAAVCVFAIYLYKAVRLVYGQAWWVALIKSLLLAVWIVPVLYVFRFLLFLVTFYST